MRIGIATDHGGFGLKEELLAKLKIAGHEVEDYGAYGLNQDDDYPDFVTPLARAVVAGKVARGLAVCGSGVGASFWATAPLKELQRKFGFQPDQVVAAAKEQLGRS